MAVNSTGRKTLRMRVRYLELKVMELERRLNLGEADHDSQGDGEYQLAAVQPPLKKLGRPPKIAKDDLIEMRDDLIPFLEVNWPNLELAFHHGARIKNMRKRQAWFEKAIPAMPNQEISFGFARVHLVKPKVVDALCEFVRDKQRYHGDPRSIANALAGADALKWRTSLDMCEKVPHRDVILVQATRAYIRRKYKKLYPKLFERPLSKQTIARLNRYEDDELWFCKQGEARIDAVMALGMPDRDLLRSLGVRFPRRLDINRKSK